MESQYIIFGVWRGLWLPVIHLHLVSQKQDVSEARNVVNNIMSITLKHSTVLNDRFIFFYDKKIKRFQFLG